MVSYARLAGHFFQAAGFIVMFYGFVQQSGLFFASGGADATIDSRIFDVAIWTAAGIVLILVGFGVIAIFARRPGRDKGGETLPFDLRGKGRL